ncbi:hypothetical protein Scep_004753 [Stephania cephalantha]|uniref:Uncharacterized protein n=1 Tax=Stephania cephalantha TaxID=152367 RepID=A0AAP0KUP1_9MAGN
MATWACLGPRVGDSADLASAARDQVFGQLDATTGGNLRFELGIGINKIKVCGVGVNKSHMINLEMSIHTLDFVRTPLELREDLRGVECKFWNVESQFNLGIACFDNLLEKKEVDGDKESMKDCTTTFEYASRAHCKTHADEHLSLLLHD